LDADPPAQGGQICTPKHSHPVGERLFVDHAGHTVEVIDAITGEVRAAQIFVAAPVLPT
jgi:hypothetical protein